ncbi:MAG: CRISPR system precrRNA processing endoribonuclease RAMP protein Cas6 [Patulibacter sp.]
MTTRPPHPADAPPLALSLTIPVLGPTRPTPGSANLLRRGVLRHAKAAHPALAERMHDDPGLHTRSWTVSPLLTQRGRQQVRVTAFGADAVTALIVSLTPGEPLVPDHWTFAPRAEWIGTQLRDDAPLGACDETRIVALRLASPTVFSGVERRALDPEITSRRLLERWRQRIIEHAPGSRLAAACDAPGVHAAAEAALVVTGDVRRERVRHPRERFFVDASIGTVQLVLPAGPHAATLAAIANAGPFLGTGRYVAQGFGQVLSVPGTSVRRPAPARRRSRPQPVRPRSGRPITAIARQRV